MSTPRRARRWPWGWGELDSVVVAALFWATAVGLATVAGHWSVGVIVAAMGAASVALESARRRAITRRWRAAIEGLTHQVASMSEWLGRPFVPPSEPELAALGEAIEALRFKLAGAAYKVSARPDDPKFTRSGMIEAPTPSPAPGADPTQSGDHVVVDMVNRLEPRSLRWIESSPSEQDFLGWPLSDLRRKSFLEIIHEDDRNLAWEQMQAALARGEAHGLIYRIKTARGESKAIEVNVGVRYAPDMTITHLRCHVADVTAKVRASRELRRRTRELTLLNQQLRKTNRELQELKDRYSDLYQNAPAMYFSLDEQSLVVECNDTLLRTLGYARGDLVGRPYQTLLPEPRGPGFVDRIEEFHRSGYIEIEDRWEKANGECIEVWLTGTAAVGDDGAVGRSRIVAQDVTARRILEAELHEKNERLARANDELSRRIKELDEFSYVVSHDLQEPLRTLIAFSDFLLRDCGDQLDATGQEYVRYLVDASRRMRALISDLLNLSRAGRVTGEFAPVDLAEVLAQVQVDFGELIRSKHAEVRLSGPLPTLWGDRDRIGQLFGNLVGNALKYNRSAVPSVEIGEVAGGPPGWATLSLRDNGIGIEPQFHSKIFQIFRRLHTREEYDGTGAGLAICQKIVQAHGGRIWVESEPGRGSTFFVSLPRRSAEAPPMRTELLHAP